MSNLPDFSIIDDLRSGLDHKKLFVLEEKLKIQAEPIDKYLQNSGLSMTSREIEEAVKNGIAKQKATCIYALRQHRFSVSDFSIRQLEGRRYAKPNWGLSLRALGWHDKDGRNFGQTLLNSISLDQSR